jgi:hypothetical protein
MIDRYFAERVRHALGPPEDVELTASGRTVVRYHDFTVFSHRGRPIAARIANGQSRFARVRKDGELAWANSLPDSRR